MELKLTKNLGKLILTQSLSRTFMELKRNRSNIHNIVIQS